VAGWKRLLSSLLWLPDDRQGFVIPAWRTARRLVHDGARLVYSTAPPYSPHLVGVALRSRRDVRWIMELRDPWADNDQKPWWVRTRVTDALDARLERYCLERADLVVTVSEGIRARLLARMPAFDQSRLVVVRNGIERLAPATRFGHRGGPVRITYVGTFYYSRDPRPFLRGLAAVRRAHGLGPEQIRVDFTGACRSVGAVSVQAEIDALGLTDVVHIHDWLPHAAAARLVEESDVLLLLAQQQPDQVPNKLYEYLGARRPILAFADAEGETERMLRRVGGHRVVTKDDQVEVERALGDVLAWARDGAPAGADSALLQEWTTESQMKRLLVAVGG
jgi:glycosyltransferase involved in cell wall biosynthesis